MTAAPLRRGGARRLADLERPGMRVDLDERCVLTLTLDNPTNLNAMTSAVADGLRLALQSVGSEARCVVLTGAGRAFCSGQDLGSDDRHMGVDVLLGEHYNPLIATIVNADRPVVAAINGIAAGIGASIALACDIRVAKEEAGLAFLFSRVGLAADGGTSWFLPRMTSPAIAAELMLRGRRVAADEAKTLGLVTSVWPGEEFGVRVEELASELAAGPAGAYALIKQQLRLSGGNTLDSQLALETETAMKAVTSPEYAEGRSAFLEKRAADFRSVGAGAG